MKEKSENKASKDGKGAKPELVKAKEADITEVTVAYTFFNMETSLDASIKKAKQP